MSDKIKLTKEEEETIIEDNKYLNKKFDISEILAFGNIPELDNDADRFLLAKQVGMFVKKNGLGNHDNLVKYMATQKSIQRIVFLKEAGLHAMEAMVKNSKYKQFLKEMIKVAIPL